MLFELWRGRNLYLCIKNCSIVMKIMLPCKKSLNIAFMQNIIFFFFFCFWGQIWPEHFCEIRLFTKLFRQFQEWKLLQISVFNVLRKTMKCCFLIVHGFVISKLNRRCWRAAHLLSSTTLMSKPGRWSLMLKWWVGVRNAWDWSKKIFL